MKRIATFIVVTTLALLLAACSGDSLNAKMDGITTAPIESASPDVSKNTPSPDSSAPTLDTTLDLKKAESLLSDYFNTLRDGFQYAHEYLYFGEYEYIREEVASFPDKIVDFVIEDSQKINDNLYEFTVLTEFDIDRAGMYVRGYTFVGRIDNNDYIIMSDAYIPEELRENLDTDKYLRFYSNTSSQDDTRAREINGKPIVQPGDPGYGMIIDEADLLINQN